jgi:hypothetical protein
MTAERAGQTLFSADGSLGGHAFKIVMPAEAGIRPGINSSSVIGLDGSRPAPGLAEMAVHPASLAFDQPL